jgi:hypothetical protein
MSDNTRQVDEGYALALVPIAKEITDFIRSRLPEGQHFGVLIPVRDPAKRGEATIIALSSDRDVIAPVAAQWALDVHRRNKEFDP